MGGIERYLLQTGRALADQGAFDPVFVCCEKTPLYHQLQQAGLKVYGLQRSSFFSKSFLRSLDFIALNRLRKIIQMEKPDIVHVHIGLLETLLPQVWGCPVIFTFHGYGTLYSNRYTNNPLKRWFKAGIQALFQQTAKRLDQLLIVSHAEQQRLLKEGFLSPENAGQVLQNGVPVDAIQKQATAINPQAFKAQLGFLPEQRIITFINRLDDNKNPCHFVALAHRFTQRPEFQDCQFLIAGDGPLRAKIQSAAERLPNLHYLGYRDDIPALLGVTDVLIYPALAEGFGLGLVEALAVGTPCLAYASEGATEILDTPETVDCLVPVGDLERLDAKLQTALSLPLSEKQQLTANLRQRAEAFDLTGAMRQLEAVYRHLTPKVSILLPVYNGADCVLKAVASVLGQTYPHWELIVIDDGSTDNTLSVLSAIQDERVRVINQNNQGVAVARNHGFTHARGDYIAFIDADDVWLPHKLAEEVKVIRKNTTADAPACLVYSSYFAVDEADRLLNLPGVYLDSGDLSEAVLAHEGIFLPSTAMTHRSVFEAIGGFKPACYHEDRVFFIQACQRFPAYPTGKRLVLYRQSLSGRCRSVLKNYEEALSAELSIVDTLSDTLTESQRELLSIRQQRNLIFRFLMYNYLVQARRLFEVLKRDGWESGEALFAGKKGTLALLSLSTGINFLVAARLLTQGFTRTIPPQWLWPAQTIIVKDTPSC